MYNANGSLQNEFFQGSTRLHLDVTDAINIMLYAAALPDGNAGVAVWHIFPQQASTLLREFICNEVTVGFQEDGYPIHNQSTYLTPPLLQVLANKYGVYPYVIHQSPGQAVFIPARCAHQVRPLPT